MQAHEGGEAIGVRVHQGSLDAEGFVVGVSPSRERPRFKEASWDEVKAEKRAEARAAFEQIEAGKAKKTEYLAKPSSED